MFVGSAMIAVKRVGCEASPSLSSGVSLARPNAPRCGSATLNHASRPPGGHPAKDPKAFKEG
jgi:hypothetical protein